LGVISRTAGLLVSGFFSIGFAVLAMITLLPTAATKLTHLNYYGVCSFAPYSTLALIVFAVVLLFVMCRIRSRAL
jgi:hypothetical protein